MTGSAPAIPGRRIRVLYVIDSLIGGGAEWSLAHMAPAYAEAGIELHVAFLKSRWEVAPPLIDAGATLHPAALDRSRPRQLVRLVGLIRRLRPDVVHTTLWEADVLGRSAAALCRVPVVTTLANSNYSPAQFDNPAVRRWKLRAAQLVDVVTARLASRFHAVSETVADDMAARLRRPRERFDVVPRSRRREVLGESNAARRSATRTRLGLDDAQPLVLGIARHEHQKGLDVLIGAAVLLAPRFPGLSVQIAGREGRETAALRSAIAAAGAEDLVRLLGVRADVADLIVAADVVVVPSRVEGLPGAVLEAMALDRPVVASDIPMVREAIGTHAARLVPVGDPVALAEAIAAVIDAPRAFDDQVAAARRRFDTRYSPAAVVAGLRAVYESAIASPSRS
ncbi:MAG: glycosyltransferase [Desertimonas sp.]